MHPWERRFWIGLLVVTAAGAALALLTVMDRGSVW
jgi:hypothetical protein